MHPTPASDDRRPWGPSLTARERMVLARLSGALDLWCVGANRDRPAEERDAALAEYQASPAVWGVLLAGALRRVELGESAYAVQVEVCRAAGADEQAAGTHLAWLRAQPGL